MFSLVSKWVSGPPAGDCPQLWPHPPAAFHNPPLFWDINGDDSEKVVVLIGAYLGNTKGL